MAAGRAGAPGKGGGAAILLGKGGGAAIFPGKGGGAGIFPGKGGGELIAEGTGGGTSGFGDDSVLGISGGAFDGICGSFNPPGNDGDTFGSGICALYCGELDIELNCDGEPDAELNLDVEPEL